MTAELGQLSLTLALALSLVLAAAGLSGARASAAVSRVIASSAAMGLFVFITVAFGALEYAAIASDFSVLNVAENSSLAKPLIYKITGVWGNHEGSMLLWVLVLSIYTAAMAVVKRGSERFKAAALGVQGLLAVAFLLFIIFTSNPFLRLDPPPFDGNGLNPLLQDLGLALHPPTLYIGYVGFSATFSYVAAALITRESDASWLRAARPFILAAWIALTAGIALGSWWAYYELGWGGFWFWDPVENASLMPWLAGTALLHSALATERTGAFRIWTLLLGIAAFSLSLIGTFLVRSGVLTSVHAFANDPERGTFILFMLVIAIGGALALFAWRAPSLETGSAFQPVSRETALLINNVLLVTAVATVFIGTLYPLFLDAFTGVKISVGPPFFALTFVPAFVALLIALPFGPLLFWQKAKLADTSAVLFPALGVALLVAAVTSVLADSHVLAAAGALGLATWVIAASLLDLVKRPVKTAAVFAVVIAHAGLGVSLIGIAGTTLWRAETLSLLGPGDTAQIGPYTLTMGRLQRDDGPNFAAIRANIQVSRGGQTLATLRPAKRVYPTEQQETVETAIRTTGFADLYLALGDERGRGQFVVRAYYNPLAPFIWIGGVLMALGGLSGLWARIRTPLPRPSAEPVLAE